jgi:hypothetical protein
LLESKVLKAIEGSTDLETLASASRTLREVEEKRKLRSDVASATRKVFDFAANLPVPESILRNSF